MQQIGINWNKMDKVQQEGYKSSAKDDMNEFDKASKVFKRENPGIVPFL
jgi:hypothetical protein